MSLIAYYLFLITCYLLLIIIIINIIAMIIMIIIIILNVIFTMIIIIFIPIARNSVILVLHSAFKAAQLLAFAPQTGNVARLPLRRHPSFWFTNSATVTTKVSF